MNSLCSPGAPRVDGTSHTHLPCLTRENRIHASGSLVLSYLSCAPGAAGCWRCGVDGTHVVTASRAHVRRGRGQHDLGVWPPEVMESGRQFPDACAPQVDELYEGYCIQCRLRDGASNMQRAFARCPPSRASRESLQELGRSLQECTEVGGGAPVWGPPGP